MSSEAIQKILKEFEGKKTAALNDGVPNAPAIKDLVSQLNSIDKLDKIHFKEFASQLKDDLFKHGVQIKGFSLDQFNSEDRGAEKFVEQLEITKYQEAQAQYIKLLMDLATCLKEHSESLKCHFILKLENSPLQKYKLLILYDETFFFQPIKKKIESQIDNVKSKSINNFRNEIAGGEHPRENFICLLLLVQRNNDGGKLSVLMDDIGTILKSFTSFEYLSIKEKSDLLGDFFQSSNIKEDFIDEIQFSTSTFLSNGAFSHEEEKIVKKLFKDIQSPLLIYKTLKAGNSGAKVTEVRPKKEFANQFERRYIVKYGPKDEKKKITSEFSRWGKWINGYKGFQKYECIHAKTLTFEGIRYSYAISDNESDSFSFKDILERPLNRFYSKKAEVIEELFSNELFDVWKDSKETVKVKISNLYSDYVKPEAVFEEVSKILDLTPSQIKEHDLYVDFYKIWEYELEVNQKVCHGDLHSENFFKDGSDIYLIDFGFTGMRHAVVDHTALECSIKFKHIPFYIPIDELVRLEEELLLDGSFQLSSQFTGTKRSEVLGFFDIIRRIRINSMTLLADPTSYLEYFLSLFLITFRQIRYRDLNQLYALKSANVIGRKLVQQLSLA